MMRSITPLADLSSCHPVHRATAMLRESLLVSTPAAPGPAGVREEHKFGLAPELAHGPLGITSSNSLVMLRDSSLGSAPTSECQRIVIHTPDGSAPLASLEDASEGDELLDYAVQQQLRTMVQAFHRRQRQASLVVACSVIAALILTLGGLILLFGMTDVAVGSPDGTAPKDSASAVQRAESPISAREKKTAEPAPLLIHARSQTPSPSLGAAVPDARIIVARPGRSLSLGPLLPLGSARYLLLRGLPKYAALSAGRRTGPGTWMVKDDDVAGLRLVVGGTASGDYPAEVYLLGTADGLQARRRFILRVDPQQSSTGQGSETASDAARERESLGERARFLLSQGNIPTARRLLTGLAERGDADAAYELALTYDQEVLAKAGFRDIEGDMETAQAWYAHAAEEGHAGAAQRLRTFAKRRAGA
jgi:hypothetical protein